MQLIEKTKQKLEKIKDKNDKYYLSLKPLVFLGQI